MSLLSESPDLMDLNDFVSDKTQSQQQSIDDSFTSSEDDICPEPVNLLQRWDSDIPLALAQKIHRHWKLSMDSMLTQAMLFRGMLSESIVGIIDKLVDCMQDGFKQYDHANDLTHGVLSAQDMVNWPQWQAVLKSAYVEMPAHYRSQLLPTLSQAYLKDILEGVEQCRLALGRIMAASPSTVDEQVLLLHVTMPETFQQLDVVNETRANLRVKWISMLEQVAMQINLAQNLTKATLQRLDHDHRLVIKYYPSLKVNKSNIHDSTPLHRENAVRNFQRGLVQAAERTGPAADKNVLVALSYLKYWTTLEGVRHSLAVIQRDDCFGDWQRALESVRCAVQPKYTV